MPPLFFRHIIGNIMKVDLFILGSVITGCLSAIVSFYKIKAYHEATLDKRGKEIMDYADKEINHLKEKTFSEIKQLEKKIDEMRDELHSNQKQLIALLTRGK